MKRKITFSQIKKAIPILAFSLFGFGESKAQVSITNSSPYTQNFDNLTQTSATWNNDQTLNDWYCTRDNVQLNASTGSTSTAGLYSLGSLNASDRALGSINSATITSTSYGLLLQNNTSNTISSFTIQYALEMWRRSSGNNTVQLSFSYKKNETSLTATGYTSVTAGTNSFGTGGGSAAVLDGNATANRQVLTFILSGVNLASGDKIMLRWSDLSSSSFNLAIDDVSVTASATAVSSNIYYSKENPNKNSVYYLNNLATWGVNTDGSGTAPTSFSNGVFIVRNRTTSTLNGAWTLGANSKVIVNEGVLTVPTAYALAGTVDVADNATLTIENATMPTLGILGGLSTVNYNSTSTVTLPDAEYGNLSIGNGNKKLSVETRIKKNLSINNSKLELDNNDLWLDEGATITGANSTGFISTKGNGKLKMKVKAGGAEVVFPVGTDVYLPVKIKQASGKADDVFSVKVYDGVYDNYTNNAPAAGSKLFTEQAVNKTWIIDEEVTGGSDITLTLGWASLDVLDNFNTDKVRIGHFYNNSWDDYSGATATLTNGIYEISRPNITSFSPFGGFSGSPGALPVELIAFNARRKNQAVECNWQTAQEINNDNFIVERSLDGKQFIEIGKVKGAGNTKQITNYQFTDFKAPEDLTYYRLRQTDLDGTFTYSKIVAVSKATIKNKLAVELYPNPTSGLRYLRSVSAISSPVEIMVINVQGKQLFTQKATAADLENGLALDLKDSPKGIYFITIRTDQEVLTVRALQE